MNVVRVKVVVGDVVVGSSARKCVGVEWCACAVVSGGIGEGAVERRGYGGRHQQNQGSTFFT